MKIQNVEHSFRHTGNFYVSRPYGLGYHTVLVFRTEAFLIIDGEKVMARPNSAIIYQPNTPQFYGIASDACAFELLCFEASAEDLAFLSEINLPLNTVFEIGDAQSVSVLVSEMFAEWCSASVHKEEAVQLYFKLLLFKLADRHEKIEQTKHDAYYEKILATRNRIYSMPEKDWSVEDLSQEMYLSVSYFQSLYKKYFGVSVMADVINSRIEYAKHLLLNTDYLLGHIAELCGYKNSVHFMRQFKKGTGMTPTEYRLNASSSHSIN